MGLKVGQPPGDAPEDYARLAGHHGVWAEFWCCQTAGDSWWWMVKAKQIVYIVDLLMMINDYIVDCLFSFVYWVDMCWSMNDGFCFRYYRIIGSYLLCSNSHEHSSTQQTYSLQHTTPGSPGEIGLVNMTVNPVVSTVGWCLSLTLW